MLKVLVPVDGSKNSDRAVTHAIGFIANSKVPVELHLLNVQLPIVSGGVRMFIKHEEIEAYHQDSGQDALRSAREQLDQAGQAYTQLVSGRPTGRTIAAYAKEQGCDHIIMGTRGLGAVPGMALGSVR